MRLTARALPLAADAGRGPRFGRRGSGAGRRAAPTPTPRRRAAPAAAAAPVADAHAGPARPRAADADRADRPADPRDARRSRSRSCPPDNPYGKTGRRARGHSAQAHVRRRDAVGRILRVGPRGPDRQAARRAARARSDSVARRRVAEVVFALGVLAGAPRRPGGRHVGRLPRRSRGLDPLSQDRPDGVHARPADRAASEAVRMADRRRVARQPESPAARPTGRRRSTRSTRRRSRRRRRGRPTRTRDRSP